MSQSSFRAAWRASDLAAVVFAILVVGFGAWLLRALDTTSTATITFGDLTFERPGQWMPAEEVSSPGSAIASLEHSVTETLAGPEDAGPAKTIDAMPATTATATEAPPVHVIYQSADHSSLRLELLNSAESVLGSWQQEVAFARAARYGAFYSASASTSVNIRGRDWLRTEFRYARRVNQSPEIASACEYATSFGDRTIVVTLHGDVKARAALETYVKPSLLLGSAGSR